VHQPGRHAGIFQFAHKNDTATRFYIGGRLGAKLKEFVCRHTVTSMADEALATAERAAQATHRRSQIERLPTTGGVPMVLRPVSSCGWSLDAGWSQDTGITDTRQGETA
jgi:hypothetical protein